VVRSEDVARAAELAADLAGMHMGESGAPGAATIVLCHGVGNSGRMWEAHMERLSAYHCLAPDLPGFGRSNHLPWRSLAHTAALVAEVIRARARDAQAHVIGLSLGGAVVHTLLAQHPERLLRVVIDGAGAIPARGTWLMMAGITALSPLVHTRPVVAGISRAFGLDEPAREDLRAASPRAFRRALGEANRVRLTRAEVGATCPTLLVAGEKELAVVRQSNATLARLMPRAEARYMPGLGHGWLGRAPEVHRRMVEGWIGSGELPAELLAETMPWSSDEAARIAGGSSWDR
jgi:pimeloyl-ACP methyl ester carboxylesterase